MASENHVTDARLRESIAKHLDRVAVYAGQGPAFCDLGDDRGTEYVIEKAAAELKHAVGLMAELKERNINQAKEEAFYAKR